MKASYQLIAVFVLAALVAATLYDCQLVPIASITLGDVDSALRVTSNRNTVEARSTIAATVTVTIRTTVSVLAPSTPMVSASELEPDVLGKHLTIAITNNYGRSLSISFASNAGGPSPVGNPSATTLSDNAFTQFSFPTGWAGRVSVGPNLNPNGSKIEGSYTGPPDIDVSYVDGYSVPITCSSEGTAVAGCNIDLFKQPKFPCEDQVDGPVCLNSARNVPDGPAPLFFAACAGAAYTYPNDNEANASNLKSQLVSCCVGTSCKAPSRQSKWDQVGKRLHVEKIKRNLLEGSVLGPRLKHPRTRRFYV